MVDCMRYLILAGLIGLLAAGQALRQPDHTNLALQALDRSSAAK
jgi:hypothetical protein